MSKLPAIGIRAVAENADGYIKSLDHIQKATDKASQAIQKSTGGTSAFSKAFQKIAGQFGGAGGQIADFASKVTGAQSELAGLTTQLPAGSVALAGVAVAAAAAAAAFVALGLRGAELTGLSDSFDRLTASVGIASDALLIGMRNAARGAVSDADLIRQANLALSGTYGEFGSFFGESLPQLLEIARAQANATGQDIGFLFQSLVTGLKRGSPLLIDNTGLTIDVTEANERYAASLGITVAQLSATDRQMALLQATLESGARAVETFGEQPETAADKLSRMNAQITNILDTMAVAVQPAFEAALDAINRVLAGIQVFVSTIIGPLFTALTNLGIMFFTGPVNALGAFIEAVNFGIDAIFKILAPIGRFIGDLIELGGIIYNAVVKPFADAFKFLQDTIGKRVREIVEFLRRWVEQNIGIDFDNLGPQLAYGAGAAFAAFANAIIAVANTLIFPAVLYIAQGIADLLIGSSPPPRGPLSQIDRGGANTMMAWLEGMTGVSLQPVEEVTANINALLGDIGTASLETVEARIAQLDAALQPFTDQLNIVKANFEAIANPAKAALAAIDRQLETAVAALARGEAGSAEAVRALDAQREAIENNLNAQQSVVDQAEIQLALAQAQQGEERVLLGIRQRQLQGVEAVADATRDAVRATSDMAGAAGSAAQAAAEKAKGGAGGAGDAGMEDMGGFGAQTGGGAFQSAIGTATGMAGSPLQRQFNAGFADTLDTSGLDQLAANQRALAVQSKRLSNVDIGGRISESLAGLGTAIQEKLGEAQEILADFVDSVINPERQGSIPYAFNQLGALASTTFEDLSTNIATGLDQAALNISSWVGSVFDPATEGSIPFALNALATSLPDLLGMVRDAFAIQFELLQTEVFTPLVDSVFNPETEGSLAWHIFNLPMHIGEWLADVGQVFQDNVVVPVQDKVAEIATTISTFFSGDGEGSLRWIIDQGVQFFIEFPGRILDALVSLGQSFFNAVAIPIIGGINAIIQGLEDLVNNALLGLANLFSQIQGVADAAGQGDAVREIVASLSGGIVLPRVPYPSMPGQAQGSIGGAARGGIFGEGSFYAGEHGKELITSAASRLSVFPASVTRNLDVLASVLPQAISMLVSSGGNNTQNTYNNGMNITFNGVSGEQNIMQRLATLRALG